MAILLLLLVAATLPALAMSFAADARRTRTQVDAAQMRQLLTAGAVTAMTQANERNLPTTRQSLALPAELSADGAKLELTFARDGGHITATIRARLRERSLEQAVDFEQRDGKWLPIAATLAP